MEHAQYSKARALNNARWQLCQLGLQGVEPDMDWSVLSMLFHLAHRPLDTEHPPPSQQPAAAAPHHQAAYRMSKGILGAEDVGDLDEEGSDSRDSASEAAEGLWDSASDLSDWSQDGTGNDAGAAPPTEAAGTGQQAVTASTKHGREGQLVKPVSRVSISSATTWGRMAAVLSTTARYSELGLDGLQAHHTAGLRRTAACPADSLAACLAQARLGPRLPLAGLSPTDCCSDGYLVHQCLALMLGASSRLFAWHDRLGRYTPRKGLHVPYLSASQLQAVLGRVADVGTQVRICDSSWSILSHDASSSLVSQGWHFLLNTPLVHHQPCKTRMSYSLMHYLPYPIALTGLTAPRFCLRCATC